MTTPTNVTTVLVKLYGSFTEFLHILWLPHTLSGIL
jgi:hypothetical protein